MSVARYYIGTGLISVVGVSFTVIPVAQGAFAQMYVNGFCPVAEDGTKLPCPDAYGALLGTAAVAALVEVLIAFIPPRIMLKIFPPLVTGPTVMVRAFSQRPVRHGHVHEGQLTDFLKLIGINLIQSGFKDWLGGSGPCSDATHVAFFDKCPDITAPHALPWGSPEYLGT